MNSSRRNLFTLESLPAAKQCDSEALSVHLHPDRGISSAVERTVHIGDVAGSTPASPTIRARRKAAQPNNRTIPELGRWERQRFWKLVDRKGADECWPWLGGTASGYGRFKARGRLYSAHRIAYTLTKGTIPRGAGYHGTVVMHGCENPTCCNPDHLTAGTHRDNVMDMVRKGRSNAQGYAPGEHPLAKKFSPEVTLAICQSPLSSREAARAFGVSTHTINRLRRENGCSRPQFVAPSRL